MSANGELRRIRRRGRVRRPRRRPIGVVAILAQAYLAACGGGIEVIGPGSGTPDGLRSLTVTVLPGPRAEAISGALGWDAGAPDAEVRFLRLGTGDWQMRSTGASGEASLSPVLPGAYRVYATRRLSESEATETGGVDRLLGDGVTVEVPGGVGTEGTELDVTLRLAADSAGGLVISEVAGWSPPPWETNGAYFDAQFIEVYNNGSDVLFLDGIVFGVTMHLGETVLGNCAASQSVRASTEGVLSRQMMAFPGVGNQFPIGPGELRVVAVSAIDHSPVHPDLPDLSDADFEIPATGFANNPSVPDMVDVGLEPFRRPSAGGTHTPLIPGVEAYFLAEPQTPADLPIAHRAFGGRGFVMVPAPTLIDVAGLTIVWPDSDREFGPCIPMVHPSFDRYEGGFMPVALGVEEERLSFQRQVLRYSDGNAVLADASVSAADFILADLTPGTLPPE